MDNMHPPRVILLHVNTLCGAPLKPAVPRHPRGYTPKGRAPVPAQKALECRRGF